MNKKLVGVMAMIAVVSVFAANVQGWNAYIYSESFGGNSADNLHGTAPDTRPDDETWTAATGWKADGSISGGADNVSAFLPFVPEAGNIYTLSATLEQPSGGSWAAIGFTADNNTGRFYDGGANNASPWMFWRSTTATSAGEIDSRAGPGTAGGSTHGNHTGTNTLSIVLNTEETNWTAEWFINDVSVRTYAFSGNPTITHVGFGRAGGAGVDFDSFSLAVVQAIILDGATFVEPNDTVDLGVVLADASTTRTFTVTNAVSASENLLLTNSPNAVVFDNGTTNQNGFTISENITGTDTNIAPGAASPFTLSFSTNLVGSYTGTVSIAYNDAERTPYEFTVTAEVVDTPAPDMAVYDGATLVDTNDTVDLGVLLVDASTNRTLTVTNSASALADLLLTNSPNAVVFANGTTSQNGFTISQNITGADTNIAPAAASSFTISFSTNVADSYSATVRIFNNDEEKDPYEFEVTAAVVLPPVTLAEFRFASGSMASSDTEPATSVSDITFGAGIDGTLENAVAGVVENRLVINTHATTENHGTHTEAAQINNALDNNMYFTFTVTIPKGVEVDLTSLVYTYSTLKAWHFGMGVFTDKTGFIYDDRLLGRYEHSSTSTETFNDEIDLSGRSDLQNLTDTTVEFRIYLSDDSSTDTREHIFDDIVLEGIVIVDGPSMQVLHEGDEIAVGDTDTWATTLINTPVSRAYTVTNLSVAGGNLLLTNTLDAVVFDNGTTNQNGFTISQNIANGATNIPPGEASSFTVSFSTNVVGTHTATIRIDNNDLAKNPYTFDVSVETLAPIPGVSTNIGVEINSLSSATLWGVLTNGLSADAYFVWDTTNHGTTSTGLWEHVISADTVTLGEPFSYEVTGLDSGATYHYAVYVTNDFGEGWSDVVTFTMPVPTDGTWITDGSGTWTDSGNWQNDIIANEVGATAYFTGGFSADSIVTLGVDRRIGNINYDNANNNFLTLSGNTLTLETVSDKPAIDVAVDGYSRRLIIESAMAGTNGFIKTGAGILNPHAANPDLTGDVRIDAGQLFLTDVDRISSVSSITLNGGTLRHSSGSAQSTDRNLVVTESGGTLSKGNSGTLNFTGGITASGSGNRTLTLFNDGSAAATLTSILSNPASGTLSLEKTGANAWTLAENNTYTGTTTIHEGTLAMSSANRIANSSKISIAGGAKLDYNISGSSSFTLSSGQDIEGTGEGTAAFNTGNNTGNGVITTGDTTISHTGSGTLRFQRLEIHGAGNVITGGNIESGTGTLRRSLVVGSGSDGDLTISGGTFDSRGTDNDDLMGNANEGTLTINGGHYINTHAGSSIFEVVFNGTATGTLNLESGSFTTGTLRYRRFNLGSPVGHVNLNGGTLSVGIIERDGATANFNFNGGTLQARETTAIFMEGLSTATVLAGGAVIDSDGHDITIGQDLVAGSPSGGLTKLGAGTLTLSGANTYTGATTVSVGTLALDASGSIAGSASITVASDATLDVSAVSEWAVVDSQALNVDGTVTGDVAVNSGGTLGGAGTVSGNVTVASGGDIVPGSAGVGTLNIGGDLDLSALSTGSGKLFFELGSVAASDKIVVDGALTIDGLRFADFDFTELAGFAEGTYTLITSSGITGDLDSDPLNITGLIGDLVCTLQIIEGDLEIVVVVASEAPPIVTSLSPDHTETGVAPWANLVATFDKDVQLLDGGTIVVSNLTAETAITLTSLTTETQVSVSGGALTIDLNDDLALGHIYAVLIDGEAIAKDDDPGSKFIGIATTNVWRFTVADKPSVSAPGATPGPASVNLQGLVTDDGGAALTMVKLYFGTSDGGDDPGAWGPPHVFDVGDLIIGDTFATNVTDLLYGVEYFYRVYAENTHLGAWSATVGPFTTDAPEGWSPADMSPVAWYDAMDFDTLTIDVGKVSEWRDRSGNNRHATQGNSANQPSYLANDPMINNLPSIGNIADNSSIGLLTASMSAKTVYVVTYYKDGVDDTFDVHSTLLSGTSGNFGEYRVMGTAGGANLISSYEFNKAGTFKNGATSSSLTVLPMPASILKLKSNEERTQAFRLGFNSSDSNRDWQGFYSEWIFTAGNEDVETEALIEGYLAHKWGLAENLPAEHPYKLNDPGVVVSVDTTFATNITSTTAELRGTLDATQSVFTVTAYWSTNSLDETTWETGRDGWAEVGTFTNEEDVSLSIPATALLADTEYFYTFRASNVATNLWAENASFTTLPTAVAPTVTANDGATNEGLDGATLHGLLTAGGFADAYFVWGLADGGNTDTGLWQNVSSAMLVLEDTPFSLEVSGLVSDSEYFYRVYATNAAGYAWSDPAETFTTLQSGALYRSGGGDWDTSSPVWGTASGGPYDADTWSNIRLDTAVFEGDTGTITLTEGITVGGVKFDTNRIITGNTLTLAEGTSLEVSTVAGPDRVGRSEISSVLAGSHGLTKTSPGWLGLMATSSSLSGNINIHEGTLYARHQALGTGSIVFTGNSTLLNVYGADKNFPATMGITVNPGVHATIRSSTSFYDAFFAGVLVGETNATLTVNPSGNAQLQFDNTANTFQGEVRLDGGGTADTGSRGVFRSLADSNQKLQINNAMFRLANGGVSMNFANRPIEMLSNNARIDNASTNPEVTITIAQDLIATIGNTARTLLLTGGNTGDNTLGGVIGNSATGTGAVNVTKQGAGKWILAGANTYSGTTTISGGTLQIGNGGTTGTLGSGSVVNNATLVFDRSDASTETSDISGTGGVVQSGSGTTILAGVNSYTGATTVYNGTLRVSGSLTATSGLAFNPGAIFSVGDTGTVDVSITISNGGILRGTGTITEAVTIASDGILQPGDPTGTLTVDDNVTINGTLQIALDGNNNSRLDATGNLNITGASLVVTGAGTSAAHIIAQYGTLTGTRFDSVTIPQGWTIEYEYDGNKIALVPPKPTIFRFR